MRVLKIVEGTSVDGPGLRTSIYLAGCNHKCPGCHNPESWDFSGGREISVDDLFEVIEYNEADVTFSGGDPLMQADELVELCRRIKSAENPRNIWCYTGYTFEEITQSPHLRTILQYIDVLVDGPFIESLKDRRLRFRGSANQRLIDVKASTHDNTVRIWDN